MQKLNFIYELIDIFGEKKAFEKSKYSSIVHRIPYYNASVLMSCSLKSL